MNRRRGLRLVVIAAVALVALVVSGLAALPEIARRVVIWRLAVTTGRAVTLAAADLDLFHGRLALRGLLVLDRDQGPLVTLERLEARFSPRDLLRGHLRITHATLQAPTLRVVRTGPGEFSISDLFPRQPKGGTTLAVTLERFVLLGGAVVLEDRTLAPPGAWRVDSVALEARGVSTVAGGPPGVVTLSAVVAGSPVTLWVTDVRLRPLRFRATVIAREIDASLAALYLPPASPLSPARGVVNASGTIEHDESTGTRVSLDARLAAIELRRPGQEDAFLSVPGVRVMVEDLRVRPGAVDLARLAVDSDRVVLEDARLAPVRRWQADGVALEARNLSSAREAPAGVATVRAVVAGSPVSVWITNLRLAPVELHATAILRDLDFTLFRLYLSPALPVQPERGVVNASFQVDHDARVGTRLAVDAGLSGVELRRPAHLVTAPSLRVTAEDIAFGNGVVSAGRITVGGNLLTLEERTLSPARKWVVQNLAVEATRLSSRRQDVQGIATARATVAGASVSAWVTGVRLDPLELHATAILRNVDLALLRLYLPSEVPVQLDRGVVNASLQVDHTAADGTRLTGDATLINVEARGRGAAGPLVAAPSLRVTLADARRHGETLSVGRIELTGSGSVADPQAAAARLDLERLRVAGEGLAWPVRGPARVELSARLRDRGELDVSGTAHLTAPPPDLAWTAELGLQFKAVNLAPLAAYVPGASGLGGRVRGRVTASVSYAGALTARVSGDADAFRLSLADGGRTLFSVRRIEAVGLDVQWPERVAVKQLRLLQPYAFVERDRQGGFPLASRLAMSRPPAAAPAPPLAPGAARPPGLGLAVGEVIVEAGRLAFADEGGAAPARFEVPRVDLTLRDMTWPAAAPARVRLDAALPAGGTVAVEGTVSAEPVSVDLQLVLKNADLGLIQPYLPFRARIRARVDATLAVAGPLTPAPRLSARGNAALSGLAVSDGQRSVITVERLDATGIDAAWPDRMSLDGIRAQRSWALIERDRQGRFLLQTLLERASGAPATPPGSPTPSPVAGSTFEFRLREGIFEEQAATIVDGVTTPPTRFEVVRARLAVQDLTWPARGPAKLQLTSPMPGGGRLDAGGTLALDPFRLEARAGLEGVSLEPAQPYLPIEGRVTGRMTGELAVKVALEPVTVKLAGEVRLQAFRLSDGDRSVVTVGRVDAVGIDVDWPGRVALQRVRLARPRLLIERDAKGEILLRRLVTPRWPATAPAGAPSPGSTPAPARPTTIEIGALNLDRASARFVDQTTTPAYVQEMSEVDVAFTGLTTVPGRRSRFTGSGTLGGGSAFKLQGEAAAGEPPLFDIKVDLRDFVVPRANPYLERFTSWTATRGSLTASATYTLAGTQLDAKHDLLLRNLEVAASGERDEVQRRLGLPLGFLVALMKDSHGEIRLSVPVSGDLSTREFDFKEAVWGAVRNLAIRLLALPFSRIGSLFFSEDSKVEAVAIDPVLFGTGTTRLEPQMGPHLERVAAFLRNAPSVSLVLAPILTVTDVDALKRDRVRARLGALPGSPGGADPLEAARREYRERWPEREVPPTLEAMIALLAKEEATPAEAVRELAARRLEVVRQELTRGGGVDGGRLTGAARRTTLFEAAGVGRVELDLKP